MPRKVMGQDVNDVFLSARESHISGGVRTALINGTQKKVPYPFPSPPDWRDCSIYFLMLDRFNNPNHPPNQRWDSICDFWQGGTFKGVQERLGYIADLGMKAIWLSPVLKTARPDSWAWNYPGYGAQNLLAVNERFGTEQDLEDLVTEAHARGLYVILDIVLNHTARVFDYVWGNGVVDNVSDASLINAPLGSEPPIQWLNGYGLPRPDWQDTIPAGTLLSADDAVWPDELRERLFFRRRGSKVTDNPGDGGFVKGDFGTMRQLVVEYDASLPGQQAIRNALGPRPVLTVLIRAYEYLIARFDFDGFRMDTVKYVHPDMIQTFGNAIREFGLSIGKKNFFTFGEIYDKEETIAQFVGRNGTNVEGFGIDAALDFPLYYKLPSVSKAIGGIGVEEIRHIFEHRKDVEKELISSHGEAGRYFVTFLDNHDQKERFFHPNTNPAQVTLGLAVLFALQGIPCVYYGTEQGLNGTRDDQGNPEVGSALECVREALWGKQPKAFDKSNPFYVEISKIAGQRNALPALRYGRLYFRQLSGNGLDFGHSFGAGGVVAFSRILGDSEVVVVANTNTLGSFKGFVLVDADINRSQPAFSVLYSNKNKQGTGTPQFGVFNFWQNTSYQGSNNGAKLYIELDPMEVQILGVK